MTRIGFLGPQGTFTEEALFTQGDLASEEPVAMATISDVISAVHDRSVELGFVPIENSIEGSVNETLDHLVFHADVLVQREVVLDVHLHLLGPSGVAPAAVRRVLSYPHASAQCRAWLGANVPDAEIVATNSTAEAARLVAERADGESAAVAPMLAARLHGLEVLASEIEDHHDNQTRFVLLAADGIPPATGHDRTSIVCFQHADRPGSLHEILGQFSARGINLTRLESRPTRQGLGQYCFVIDLEGHVADAMVADALRDLHADLAEVKFLGSYPAAGEDGGERRAAAAASWEAADRWLASLLGRIRG